MIRYYMPPYNTPAIQTQHYTRGSNFSIGNTLFAAVTRSRFVDSLDSPVSLPKSKPDQNSMASLTFCREQNRSEWRIKFDDRTGVVVSSTGVVKIRYLTKATSPYGIYFPTIFLQGPTLAGYRIVPLSR